MYGLFHFVVRAAPWGLAVALAALACLLQFRLSGLALVLVVLLALALWRPAVPWRHAIIGLALALAVFAPYVVWLVDSNVDWGQDLKGLAAFRRAHPDEPFYLSYFGTAKPEFYGIRGSFLPGPFAPGWSPDVFRADVVPFSRVPSGAIVAVSVTNLQSVFLTDAEVPGIEPFMERLKRLQPIASIGHSILVFRIP